ncbi:MAG TPA: hypothetical protein PKN44_15965 [Bacteroidales bacterium]|nr:hypothetical protein [Bacteroidales bacterium]HPS63117.1 hypothetical protein [Bacteroidales bacterium]
MRLFKLELNLHKLLIFTILAGLFVFSPSLIVAQGGGPPMLTTDPGTPGKNHWEINTSLNYHFSTPSNIQIPTTEIVYGIGNHYQVSVQLPMLDVEWNKSHFTTFTQPQMGIKCQLSDEQKQSISVSVYPQIIIPIQKETHTQIFIPLEFEKTFKNFRVGEEIGYFILSPTIIFNGTIVGYHFKNDLELMGEFYLSKLISQPQSTTGLLNFGVRKQLNHHLVMMSSMGTEIITPYHEERQYLFGLMGIQILLGE